MMMMMVIWRAYMFLCEVNRCKNMFYMNDWMIWCFSGFKKQKKTFLW